MEPPKSEPGSELEPPESGAPEFEPTKNPKYTKGINRFRFCCDFLIFFRVFRVFRGLIPVYFPLQLPASSDVQDSHVLDRRILDDLNRASRQGFHLFDCLLDAVS